MSGQNHVSCYMFQDNDWSTNIWVSMKFNQKVSHCKSKVGIDYDGSWPNLFNNEGAKIFWFLDNNLSLHVGYVSASLSSISCAVSWLICLLLFSNLHVVSTILSFVCSLSASLWWMFMRVFVLYYCHVVLSFRRYLYPMQRSYGGYNVLDPSVRQSCFFSTQLLWKKHNSISWNIFR